MRNVSSELRQAARMHSEASKARKLGQTAKAKKILSSVCDIVDAVACELHRERVNITIEHAHATEPILMLITPPTLKSCPSEFE